MDDIAILWPKAVLSPLSLSLFKDIHVTISCKHTSILGTITDESELNEK